MEPKIKIDSVLDRLKEVKGLSDKRQYPAKHARAMALIAKYPEKFTIDSEGEGVVGITHIPTGFRFHLPRKVISGVELQRQEEVPALLNMEVTDGETKKAELLVEFAETPRAQLIGLSHRPVMPKSFGMLFKTATSFWMRDCNFDLDAAFLSENGRILDICRMEKKSFPKTYRSQSEEPPALAIELPAGWCVENKVVPGDHLRLINP